MDIVLILCFALILFGAKLKIADFHEDYLCREQSNAIKGIFIIFVFFRHLIPYVKDWGRLDTGLLLLNKYLGQLIVVMFLFYSGYGVAKAIENKGMHYVRNMPRKRIFPVWFRFAIAVGLFYLLNLSMGKHFPTKQVLLSLVGWEGLGNSNWYIFVIIILYIITLLAALICHADKHLTWITVFLGSVGFIYLLSLYKDDYWYNTLLIYSFGMFYAVYQKQLEQFFFRKCAYICSLFLSVFVLAAAYMIYSSAKEEAVLFLCYEIIVFAFTLLVLLVTMKLSVRNRILQYMGRHLFSLYILQRLPMIALREMAINGNRYLYFIVCLVVTLILAYLFDLLTNMDFYKRCRERLHSK